MPCSEKITEYLEQVCGQVRWHKAHSVIRRELEDHLLDQAQAFEDEGHSPEKAAEMAVLEMGDPVMIGTQFDRSYRPQFHWPILVTALFLIGFVLLARTMMYAQNGMLTPISDTLFALLISAGVLLTVLKIDYTILSRTWLIYGGYLTGLVLFWLLSLSHGRWVLLLSYYKITVAPLVCASLAYHYRNGGLVRLYLCLLLCFVPLAFALGLMGPLLWGAMTFSVVLIVALTSGAFPKVMLRGFVIFGLGTMFPSCYAAVLMLLPEDRLALRMNVFFPQRDPEGYGYLGMMVREALSQAKWFGSAENFSEIVLPVSGVDYLLTWTICRFGWICLVGALLLLCMIAVFGIRMYRRQHGVLARMVLAGVYSVWGAQAISSLLVNLGFCTMFSYPFPFFGGNVALIFNSVLLGLLLSVCQMGTLGTALANSGGTAPLQVRFARNRRSLDIKIKW